MLYSDSLRTVVDGLSETNRKGLLTRVNLAESQTESLWVALSYEKTTREATLLFEDADSTWSDLYNESENGAQTGLGFDGGRFSGSVTAIDATSGTRFEGAGEIHQEIEGLSCFVGASVSRTQRGLNDIWWWRSQGTREPEPNKGTLGLGWASLGGAQESLSARVGIVVGYAWDAWGWCSSDSLPPGRYALWGPQALSVVGSTVEGSLTLAEPLRIDFQASWLPWRLDGDPVPFWPDLRLLAQAGYSRSFGTAAIAHLTGSLRYVSTRYAGLAKQLLADPVWVLNGQAEIEIGDFTVLCLLENLTGQRFEEVRGYPIEGVHLQLGFHWQFWD
jgi:hypothetical protein